MSGATNIHYHIALMPRTIPRNHCVRAFDLRGYPVPTTLLQLRIRPQMPAVSSLDTTVGKFDTHHLK
jgi:hypothetical protein